MSREKSNYYQKKHNFRQNANFCIVSPCIFAYSGKRQWKFFIPCAFFVHIWRELICFWEAYFVQKDCNISWNSQKKMKKRKNRKAELPDSPRLTLRWRTKRETLWHMYKIVSRKVVLTEKTCKPKEKYGIIKRMIAWCVQRKCLWKKSQRYLFFIFINWYSAPACS